MKNEDSILKKIIKQPILQKVLKQLNDREYTDLAKFLDSVDWFSIPREQIVPREKVRTFIKSIENEETRLNVARYLQKYEDYYFKESDNGFTADFGPDPIAEFHRELEYLIQQLTTRGDFSDRKFNEMRIRKEQVEKQNKELQERIKKLEGKIYAYEHRGDNLYIPEKLFSHEFMHIAQLLTQKQIVISHYKTDDYGYQRLAYMTWKEQCDLFGYFVDKISYELELRDSGGRLQWKLFAKAFDNYKEIERAAKNTVARYQTHPETKMPENAEIIDNIIEIASAYEAERQAKEKQI